MKIAALALIGVLLPGTSQAAPDSTAMRGVVIGLSIGAGLTPSAPEMFDAYHATLGGGALTFPALTGLGGSMAIELSPVFSVLLQAQAFTLALDDTGTVAVYNSATGLTNITARSAERWTAQTYPFLVGLRYAPVASRFQSYGQVMVGIAATHIRWDHTSTYAADERLSPSSVFESLSAVPTAAVGVGLELMFDSFQHRELLRSFFVEARYRWTGASYDVFGPLATQSDAPAPEWQRRYAMSFGGFELLAGVNLQFYRQSSEASHQ